MTRRRKAPADSLDLLLDTICNTFGGILFIALLVVLLLQVSGTPQAAMSTTEMLQASELQHQQQTLTELKSRLQSTLEQQRPTLDSLSDRDADVTLTQYQVEETQLESLKAKITAIQRRQLELKNEDERRLEEIKQLERNLKTFQSEIDEARKTQARQRDSRRKTLDLPAVRDPGIRSQVTVILQFHRFYLWHRYSSDGSREGLNTDNFLILGEEGPGIQTSPNPAAGVPLDGSESSKQRLIQQLSRFNRSRHYLMVVVRPDSYGDFEQVRTAATALQLEYDLRPSTVDDVWLDRGGTKGLVQ